MQVRRRDTSEILAMKVLKKENIFARNDPKDLQHTISERNVLALVNNEARRNPVRKPSFRPPFRSGRQSAPSHWCQQPASVGSRLPSTLRRRRARQAGLDTTLLLALGCPPRSGGAAEPLLGSLAGALAPLAASRRAVVTSHRTSHLSLLTKLDRTGAPLHPGPPLRLPHAGQAILCTQLLQRRRPVLPPQQVQEVQGAAGARLSRQQHAFPRPRAGSPSPLAASARPTRCVRAAALLFLVPRSLLRTSYFLLLTSYFLLPRLVTGIAC